MKVHIIATKELLKWVPSLSVIQKNSETGAIDVVVFTVISRHSSASAKSSSTTVKLRHTLSFLLRLLLTMIGVGKV